MQIIRKIESKRVVYMLAEEEFVALRNDRLITDKFTAYDIGLTTHDLVIGVPAPDVFVGSALIYDDGWFVVDQQAIDAEVERLRIASVPQEVSMRQARLALLAAGLLDDVDAALAASPRAAQIEWEYAQTIRRGYPLIVQLAAALGMTDAQLDALFTAAANL